MRILAAVLLIGVAGATLAETVPTTIGPVTHMPLPRFVSLKTEANARRGPGLDHRVDWIFKRRHMPLKVVAEFDNWRKVVDADGTGGWVHYTLLRGARTVVVRAPETMLHELASDNSLPVAVAKQGVIGDLESCKALWCQIDANGYEGWVRKDDIWGVDDTEIDLD
ncbi:hypothetical protein FDP22_07275 [Paroceanicella profunda]|uniref:Aspartyl-trna synthetase n=1 Tax=Paroceanicella profunda TaxID=2579971 RepID=A0A5B8FS59_9RHOB|nr:SH3 domain-containing protein [Paroceanicella profunda]QDL91606.1 hypothetical protein FDP22_07275 [Paroceanicella profunda]